jgi:3-oxoadipate CoA-transferase alpha subunit
VIDKRVASVSDALAGIADGATVLVAGFGAAGQPLQLIEGLVERGTRDLTIVSNNPGAGESPLARLMALGRVRKVVCSFPRVPGAEIFNELYRAGRIELEVVPQGTLAERLRAAGAGIPAFFTPTGAGTLLAEGKETRVIDGRACVLENALQGDVALIEAWHADRLGNLVYRQSGRNYNPVMAMAGRLTVVQTQHLADAGEIDPETIVTPGIFVDRVVHIPYEAGAP